MARTHINRIDNLYAGILVVPPIARGDPDQEAVGAVQDLLFGLEMPAVPLYTQPNWGTFGRRTEEAVRRLQRLAGRPQTGQVDSATLWEMVQRQHPRPRATRAYIALRLDIEFNNWIKVLSLVAIVESGAKFAGMNNNTDQAGLSLGIIQWAQRPGRLDDILLAMRTAQPALFDQIVGGPANAIGMITHAQLPNGGVNPTTGVTTDAAYNFIAQPWTTRFRNLCSAIELQVVQVGEAVTDFQGIRAHVNTFAAGVITSERGVAFMIDLCNQHGRNGGRNVYLAAVTTGMTEPQALTAVGDESVRRVEAQYGVGSNEARSTRSRRDFFRTTPLLADTPFNP